MHPPVTDPISSYRTEQLRVYFERYVSRPLIGRLVGGAEGEPEVKTALGPLSLALKLPLVNRLARDQAFRYAAWLWLRPNHPSWEDIDSLKARVGLEKFAFAPGLKAVVLEYLREHEALRLWIERRVALIELTTDAPTESFEDLQHTAFALRRELFHAVTILNRGDRTNARALAIQIARSALLGAGQVCMRVLGKNGCPFSVNLMLRTRLEPAAFHFKPGTLESINAQNAAALWRGIQAKHALIIAEEAGEPEHTGFWVPLKVGENGDYLPGASQAFNSMIGSAVFKNDLPPLDGFEKSVEDRWHGHMRAAFQERLFVSLPLTAPSDGQTSRVVAILNVNAEPDLASDGWRRAYHNAWLAIAKDRVAQFVEAAFFAHLIKRATDPSLRAAVTLELGATPWQSLPGLET